MYGQRFETRYLASFTDYLNSVTQSFNAFYQRADFLLGTTSANYGIYVDTYFLNRSNFSLYNWDAGLIWSRVLKASDSRVLILEAPLQYQKFINDPSLSSDNDRTGVNFKLRGTSRWLKGESEIFSVQLGLEGQYTSGMNYRNFGLNLPLQWIKPLPFLSKFGILNSFSLEGQAINFFQSSSGRKDLLMRGGAGLLKTFFSQWNASLFYSYQKNSSTLSTARYSKDVISLQVSREFK
jgi:hypothetical protein